MLFNYNSGLKQVFNRDGSYLPGQKAKTGWKLVESLNSNQVIEFGQVVKRVIDETTNVPLATSIVEDDDYTSFYGVALRDVVSQSSSNFNSTNANYITNYYIGCPISVMREGYVSVPVQNGEPYVGGQVYVRVAPSIKNPNLPIGGIEALGDVGNVAWKNVFFKSNGYFAMEGTNNYTTSENPTSQCATIQLMISEYKPQPTITQAPTVTAAPYGTTMSELQLNGGSASVDGTFVMNNPNYIPPVGSGVTYTATFIPDDIENYDPVTNVEVSITINKVTPQIITPPVTDGNLYYGDALSTLNLINGVASTSGTFSWEEENTRPQDSGNQTVIFTPDDINDYNVVNNINVNVTVVQVPTEVSVLPTATSVATGSQLSTSTINGGVVINSLTNETVDGSWAWEEPTTVVNESGQYLAIFEPENADKYETVSTLISVDITE